MKFIILIMIVMESLFCKGQTTDEWIRQKKTQIRYLKNQIVANKVYIDYLCKGYSIARKGLNTIKQIKSGDFNLHNKFFQLLEECSPYVKKYGRLRELVLLQFTIERELRNFSVLIDQHSVLSAQEQKRLISFESGIRSELSNSVNHLSFVLDNNNMSMTDDERFMWIDEMYNEMQTLARELRSISIEQVLLIKNRQMELRDIEFSKKINQ